MSGQLRAAVVGAGAMGARLDMPGVAMPLTHAGGFRVAGFNLVALVDPAADVKSLAQTWGCAGYGDFDTMMREEKPDVISLAVPTTERADLLTRALVYRPRLVIAEKPLSASLALSQQIVAAYREAAIPLLVNYTRRFVPVWRSLIGSDAMSATIRYAKGVRHNGTHAFDLCRMLFGECTDAAALSKRDDYWPDDPTISAFLRFDRCEQVFLQALDERCFTLFEVDIFWPDRRIVVDQDGRRLRRFVLKENVGIPPGRRLVEIDSEDTGAASAMSNLMRHAQDVLAGAAPWCSGEDALAAERIADRLAVA
jgi:predicted dehydrogenase